MGTRLGADVDASLLGLADELRPHDGADVDDVQPAAGFGAQLDRPEDRIDLRFWRPRPDEIARAVAVHLVGLPLDDLLVFRVQQQRRPERGDSMHPLAQHVLVAGRELFDSARTHERFETDDTAPHQLLDVIQVAGYESAPEPEIHARRPGRRLQLEIEWSAGDSHRPAVQRHVDERRVTARRQSRRAVGDRLPFGSPGLIEVDVRVDTARKDVEA